MPEFTLKRPFAKPCKNTDGKSSRIYITTTQFQMFSNAVYFYGIKNAFYLERIVYIKRHSGTIVFL